MDLEFAKRELPRADAVALGYPELAAMLAAAQALSPTACAEARDRRRPPPLHPVDALVRVLRGEGEWAAAATVLRGSFHPAGATVHRGNPR